MRFFDNNPQSSYAEVTQFFDGSGRLIQSFRETQSGVTEVKRYAYDERGRLIQTSRETQGGVTEVTQYTYDYLDQLVRVVSRQIPGADAADGQLFQHSDLIQTQQNLEDDEKEPERYLAP